VVWCVLIQQVVRYINVELENANPLKVECILFCINLFFNKGAFSFVHNLLYIYVKIATKQQQQANRRNQVESIQ
jgi:hypothetical protein